MNSESGHLICSAAASDRALTTIPKGLRPPAQGCEERATLGKTCLERTNPVRVVPVPLHSQVRKIWATTLSGLNLCRDSYQGSSFLATLGFVTESLWDSSSHSGDSNLRVKFTASEPRPLIDPKRRRASLAAALHGALLLLAILSPLHAQADGGFVRVREAQG